MCMKHAYMDRVSKSAKRTRRACVCVYVCGYWRTCYLLCEVGVALPQLRDLLVGCLQQRTVCPQTPYDHTHAHTGHTCVRWAHTMTRRKCPPILTHIAELHLPLDVDAVVQRHVYSLPMESPKQCGCAVCISGSTPLPHTIQHAALVWPTVRLRSLHVWLRRSHGETRSVADIHTHRAPV